MCRFLQINYEKTHFAHLEQIPVNNLNGSMFTLGMFSYCLHVFLLTTLWFYFQGLHEGRVLNTVTSHKIPTHIQPMAEYIYLF